MFDEMLHSGEKPIFLYIPWLLNREYHFDIAWPGNYFAWLFNNIEDHHVIPDIPDRVKRDIDIEVGNLRIQGSGILTGDFGQSIIHRKGVPALELYGVSLVPMYSVFLSVLLLLMLCAVLQRWARPNPYRSSRIPANARWRPAELWTMG